MDISDRASPDSFNSSVCQYVAEKSWWQSQCGSSTGSIKTKLKWIWRSGSMAMHGMAHGSDMFQFSFSGSMSSMFPSMFPWINSSTRPSHWHLGAGLGLQVLTVDSSGFILGFLPEDWSLFATQVAGTTCKENSVYTWKKSPWKHPETPKIPWNPIIQIPWNSTKVHPLISCFECFCVLTLRFNFGAFVNFSALPTELPALEEDLPGFFSGGKNMVNPNGEAAIFEGGNVVKTIVKYYSHSTMYKPSPIRG